MKKYLLTKALLCLFLFVAHAQENESLQTLDELVNNAEPFVENKTNGSINWTEQYIEAKGESVLDTVRFKNLAQANAMASRGAVVVAQRNLLEIIEGVRIQGETTVRDFMTESDVITTRVDGVLKNAQVVDGPKLNSFGLMEVTVRVPLYSNDGLASAVYKPTPPSVTQIPVKTEDVKTKPETEKNKKSKDVEPVKQLTNSDSNKEEIESLIFKVIGGQYSPEMFPKIEDIDGNVLLDMMEQYGMNKNDFPKLLKDNPNILKQIQNNPKAKIVELFQDNSGKLIAQGNGKEVLKKIKNTSLDVLKIAKSIILF